MFSRFSLKPLAAGFAGVLLVGLSACSGDSAETRIQEQSAALPAPAHAQLPQSIVAARHRMDAQRAYAPGPAFIGQPQMVEREQYASLPDNPVQAVAEQPVSTFSIDVDTGSYANVRRFLNDGRLPPADAVRLEEMLNYFSYDYPAPQGDVPFGVSTELAPTPWNPHSQLLRVAIQAAELQTDELPPANLVFLVDVSGSMHRREGLPMVQATLRLLVDQLRARDRVSLVTYAGTSEVVLDSTPGNEKAKIRQAIDNLVAGGSTAGESGIRLAYQQAEKGYVEKGINRILLATDGDFNVGISDFASLKKLAAEKRKSGVSLTTLGFGMGNYNEQLMEQLADAGDGNYAYIDTLREARKVLVEQLASTLTVLARDVKIQVEFNPARVSEYRLLGYENRALKREDFNNDKVDAGEIGAGHRVTALYEIVPAGKRGWLEPLRYQAAPQVSDTSGELALLRLRWKAPEQDRSRLLEVPVQATAVGSLARASEDLRFAAAVAAFAQQLKGGTYTGDFSLADSAELARSAKGEDRFGLRGEFVQLVELAQSLRASSGRAGGTD